MFLAPALVEMLGDHVEKELPRRRLRPVDIRRHGKEPPHQNTVGNRWRSTLNIAGLTGMELHNLRHFYASGPITANCECGDGATCTWALQGHGDAQHLLAPMADR